MLKKYDGLFSTQTPTPFFAIESGFIGGMFINLGTICWESCGEGL